MKNKNIVPVLLGLLLLLAGCGAGKQPAPSPQPLQPAPAPAQPQPQATGAEAPAPPKTSVERAIEIYNANRGDKGEEFAARMALRQCGIRSGSPNALEFYKAVGLQPPSSGGASSIPMSKAGQASPEGKDGDSGQEP